MNPLLTFKKSFESCQCDGPLMIYICKLFSVRGCDIAGMTVDMLNKLLLIDRSR